VAAPTYRTSTPTASDSYTPTGAGEAVSLSLSIARADFSSTVRSTSTAVVVARYNYQSRWNASTGTTSLAGSVPPAWTAAAFVQQTSGGTSTRYTTGIAVYVVPVVDLDGTITYDADASAPTGAYPFNVSVHALNYSSSAQTTLVGADFTAVSGTGATTTGGTLNAPDIADPVTYIQVTASSLNGTATVDTANGWTSRYTNNTRPTVITLDQAATGAAPANYALIDNNGTDITGATRWVSAAFALEAVPVGRRGLGLVR
jgi:hypothetical protein